MSKPAASFEESVAFLAKMGKSLHRYGTPAHRLERALARSSAKLGIEGQFFSTPTALIAAFKDGPLELTKLARIRPGEVHLQKMAQLDRVGDMVVDGELSPSEGDRRIDEILAAPPPYSDGVTLAGFAAVSASASTFFGAGWPDLLPAALVGVLIGALSLWAESREEHAGIFEALAAFGATLAALALSQWIPGISTTVVILAGLIVLIPGLSVTVAVAELATRNAVSGTARLMDSLTVFLKIAFGVAMGTQLGKLVGLASPWVAPRVLPEWAGLAALVVAPLGFTVLFKAERRDAGWILLSGFAAVYGAKLGAALFGPELGLSAGGFIVGFGSNLYGERLNRPSMVTRVPGIILLVPGIIGYRSLALMSAGDFVSGVGAGFSMMIMAVSLVGGLFFANAIAVPRRSL